MELIGYRNYTYTRKSDGERVNAITLYVMEDAKNVVGGKRCFEQYAKADVVEGTLNPGDEIQILYNRFGSVESVRTVGAY